MKTKSSVSPGLTLVASSLALVCSAMKLTQTQLLCMAGLHLVWSNGGV